MNLRAYGKYGLTSPSWMVKAIGEREYRRVFDLLGRRFATARVLDIGCGSGEKRAVLPPGVEYVGVDHADSPHGTTNADHLCSAYDLTFPDESFDGVFCTGVLEHLEEPLLALEESCRVLRPGGVAIYTMPLFWHVHEEPRDFYRYTEFGLRFLFEKAGYQIERMIPLSGFWVTFGSELNYYIQRFSRGPFKPAIKAAVVANNLVFSLLERGLPRDERFTWMYLVVARKPGG